MPFIPVGLQNVLEFIGEMKSGSDPEPDGWMHVHLVGQPVDSTERADDFITTIDIVNITNGSVDDSWTTSDLDAVAGQLGNLMDQWVPRMSNDYRWKELRFYHRYFNPYTLDEPYQKSGPPVAIYPKATVGAASSYQAPQVAVTTTERTAYPRHWGRNYWPHPQGGMIQTGGYIPNANVDSWCTAVHDVYSQLAGGEFYPVVPITTYKVGDVSVPTRGLLGVTEIQMDNLFDVMRSRRPSKSTYKKILPL